MKLQIFKHLKRTRGTTNSIVTYTWKKEKKKGVAHTEGTEQQGKIQLHIRGNLDQVEPKKNL